MTNTTTQATANTELVQAPQTKRSLLKTAGYVIGGAAVLAAAGYGIYRLATRGDSALVEEVVDKIPEVIGDATDVA